MGHRQSRRSHRCGGPNDKGLSDDGRFQRSHLKAETPARDGGIERGRREEFTVAKESSRPKSDSPTHLPLKNQNPSVTTSSCFRNSDCGRMKKTFVRQEKNP